MDVRQLTSASNHSRDRDASHDRRRSLGRHPGEHAFGPAPMAIRTSHRGPVQAPPPLPPPRFIKEEEPLPGPGLISPRAFSSMDSRAQDDWTPSSAGLSFPKSWGARMATGEGQDRTIPGWRGKPQASSLSALRSPTDSERRYDAIRHQDEGYYSISAPDPASSQQLPGEKSLHHRDQEKSSQAYDKNLLSKIGKPDTTPPRPPNHVNSTESSPSSILSFSQRRLSNQYRSLSFPNANAGTLSDPPIKQESPSTRFPSTTESRPLSPLSASSSSTTASYLDFRSPIYDQSSRPPLPPGDSDSIALISHRFPSSPNIPRQPKSRRSGSGSLLSQFDESAYNTTNDIKRVNYSQPNFSEQESTFRMEETVKHLHLDDRSPRCQYTDGFPRHPNQSPTLPPMMAHARSDRKRKASEYTAEDAQMQSALLQQTAHNANDYSDHALRQQLQAQSATPYHTHPSNIHPDIASPTYRSNAYASPGRSPIAESDYPSALAQPLTSGVSPTSEHAHYASLSSQQSQYAAMAMDAAPPGYRANPYPHMQQSISSLHQQPEPEHGQVRSAIEMQDPLSCTCCKKPRKFETAEQLEHHRSEKQYSCMYCHNRFKNKNEAERHQNSLHRRLHSWSCSAIGTDYTLAFFPSASIPPVNNSNNNNLNHDNNPDQPQSHLSALSPHGPPSLNDICGYCGEEFSNEPAPNWQERQSHLSQNHKFGECNQGKKFFRADHFRQHLKHSHGGKNGKHTNSLEQACIRDEPPPKPMDSAQSSASAALLASAPIANMGSLGAVGPGPGPGPDPGPISGSQHDPLQAPSMQPHHPPNPTTSTSPRMSQLDMSNIDPDISFMQHQQQSQTHPQHTLPLQSPPADNVNIARDHNSDGAVHIGNRGSGGGRTGHSQMKDEI